MNISKLRQLPKHSSKTASQQGFTIVELMIATAVLSVILVMITIMMSNIGNLYYKGIKQSQIQDTIRAISDDVTQHLQASNATTTVHATPAPSVTSNYGSEFAVCIGTTRYTYVLGKQMGSAANQTQHVLWRDDAPADCTDYLPDLSQSNPNTYPSSYTPSTPAAELMAAHSRLLSFSITQSPSTGAFRVIVNIAGGDSDLLCSPQLPTSGTNSCSGGPNLADTDFALHAANTSPPTIFYQCKGGDANRFCATAGLDTTVTERLN